MSEKRKWSKSVHLKGDLHGWHERQSAEVRHEHLRTSVRDDGYATTVRRVNFLRNIADREDNRELHRVAGEDVRWLEKMHGEGMV